MAAPFNFNTDRLNHNGIISYHVNDHWLSIDDEARQQTQTDYNGKSCSQGDHETYVFLRAVKAIVTKNWYDHSDIQTDYFDTAFYYSINVGHWQKGFTKTERPEWLETLEDPEPVREDTEEEKQAAAARLRLEEEVRAEYAKTFVPFHKPEVPAAKPVEQSKLPYDEFLAEQLEVNGGSLIFYKSSPEVDTLGTSALRLWKTFSLSEAKSAVAKGMFLLDEEIEAKFQSDRGFTVQEYFYKLARGEY